MSELLSRQRGGNIVRFMPLGMTIPIEKQVNILGIDLDTKLIINLKAQEEQVANSRINLFDLYDVTSRVMTSGLPQMQLVEAKKISDIEDINATQILDFMSTNLRPVINKCNYFSVVKVSELLDLVIGNTRADIHVKIAGMPNDSFMVTVSDWKWKSYWEINGVQNSDYAKLKKYLSSNDFYLVLDTDQEVSSGLLKCLSLVVV